MLSCQLKKKETMIRMCR
uniref:Uncharacterized protein n=1 Tax=Arundo donax TaxID=35708 RepID=A0A0A9AQ02_ARUDO